MTSTKKAVTIKNDGETPIPTEVIAESIVAISQGIKKLRSGRLNDRCLFLLIQHAAPSMAGYPPKRVGMNDVKAVIEGIEALEKTFIRKATSPSSSQL